MHIPVHPSPPSWVLSEALPCLRKTTRFFVRWGGATDIASMLDVWCHQCFLPPLDPVGCGPHESLLDMRNQRALPFSCCLVRCQTIVYLPLW
jgi:hypothetical protein